MQLGNKGNLSEERIQALEAQLEVIEKQNSELLWASYFRDSITSSEWVKNKSFSAVGGAASYSFLYKLYRIYDVIKPISILEFGLGQSTNLTRQYCIANKKAKAVVVDHDEVWVDAYSNLIKGVDNVSLLLCDTEDYLLPDGSVGAKDTQYASLKTKLKNKKYNPTYDLIIVDGPIGVGKPYSRTDVLGLTDKLASTFVIIIDDSNRDGEQRTVELLRQQLDKKKIKYSDWTVNGLKQQTYFSSPDIADLLWAI